MTELETRLREELAAAARDVRPSPDAWQQNQRLLAADRSGRRSRVTWLLSAAAAVVVIVAGFVTLSGTGDNRPTPPTGSDPFDNGALGKPVEVARLGSGPDQLRVEMSIASGKGSRPDMCTRFITGPDSSSSCGGQSPDPENARVAFDYLSGSKGATTSVEGVVDTRVSSVRAWLMDGTEVRPRLVALGVDKLRGFAVPTAQDSPYAMRLAAYASDGTALEYVNLAARSGADWFPQGGGPVSGCPADMDCVLEHLRPGLIAKVVRGKDRIVVLLWPDVREVGISGANAEYRSELSAVAGGTLIHSFEVTPANFGGTLDGDLVVSASDGVNTVEMDLPAGRLSP
jgi:hypothetical protein